MRYVCPVCDRTYETDLKNCPEDGTDLISFEDVAKEFSDPPLFGRVVRMSECIPVRRNGQDAGATRAAAFAGSSRHRA